MEYVIAFIIIIISVISVIGKLRHKRETINILKNNYGKYYAREYSDKEYETISSYFYNETKDRFTIDDITYNDLNLDKVYAQINGSVSSIGDDYTYKTLRTPEFSKDKLKTRDKLATYFDENEDSRIDTQYKLSRVGKVKGISIYDILKNMDVIKETSNILEYIILLAIFVCGLLSFKNEKFVILIIFLCICNIFRHISRYSRLNSHIIIFKYIINVKKVMKKIYKKNRNIFEDYKDEIDEVNKKLSYVNRYSFFIKEQSDDVVSMLFSYINMIVHIDIICFNILIKRLNRDVDIIMKMYELVGEIELAINIASYRNAVPIYTKPEFTSEKILYTREIIHPLLMEAVVNDIDIVNNVLITGSNASGKSTFVKALGVNSILAQTIYTVLANEYRGAYFKTMSSMALRDNIEANESYYMVEIKSLKRIVEEDMNTPVFCLVDEILRGTNTVERIAASSIILESLNEKNCICIAATHDIELTYILEGVYDNYHFTEEIDGKDIKFDYKLKNGRATSRNAIKLLGMIGFSEEIVDKAEKRAMKLDGVDGEKNGIV